MTSLLQAVVQVSAAGPPLAPAAAVAAAAAAALLAAPWASRLYKHDSCPAAMSAAILSQACGFHEKFQQEWQSYSQTGRRKAKLVQVLLSHSLR